MSSTTSSSNNNNSSSSSSNSMSSSAILWLVLWMANNIGVTLLNKASFAVVDFKYPYALSAVHMLCNWIGAQMIFSQQEQQQPQQQQSTSGNNSSNNIVTRLLGRIQRRQVLDRTGQWYILAFSVVFSMNIAIGNVSLRFVSVNFNQVMRSLVPALTIAMGRFILRHKISTRRQMAVVPIIGGVAMACFGDMSYTMIGLLYTVLCVVLAATKVVASGELLTGALKFHPVDLLGHMAPLAFCQCLLISYGTGEVTAIAGRWSTELSPTVNPLPLAVVGLSGIMSFSLNICSLQANRLTSPLTLCIAANVKQVLMIVLSTILFRVHISPLNGAGILVVLAGSARYSYVCVVEKQQANKDNEQTLPLDAKKHTSHVSTSTDEKQDDLTVVGSSSDEDDELQNNNVQEQQRLFPSSQPGEKRDAIV